MVGVLISIALLTTVAMGFMTLNSHMSNQMKQIRITATRDSIKMQMDRFSTDTRVLVLSSQYVGDNSAGNILLNYCLNGTPTQAPVPACAPNCCTAVPEATPQPFMMVDPGAPNSFLAGTDPAMGTIAPTNLQPVSYDQHGNSCEGDACVLQVFSSFSADCGGAPACAKAASVKINYMIKGSTSVSFPLQSMQRSLTVPASFSASGSGAQNCSPITMANMADCYDSKKSAPMASPGAQIESLSLLCGHMGYRGTARGTERVEFRKGADGKIWAWGLGFPNPNAGSDCGGWTCCGWPTVDKALCDISSGQCSYQTVGNYPGHNRTHYVKVEGSFVSIGMQQEDCDNDHDGNNINCRTYINYQYRAMLSE